MTQNFNSTKISGKIQKNILQNIKTAHIIQNPASVTIFITYFINESSENLFNIRVLTSFIVKIWSACKYKLPLLFTKSHKPDHIINSGLLKPEKL